MNAKQPTLSATAGEFQQKPYSGLPVPPLMPEAHPLFLPQEEAIGAHLRLVLQVDRIYYGLSRMGDYSSNEAETALVCDEVAKEKLDTLKVAIVKERGRSVFDEF